MKKRRFILENWSVVVIICLVLVAIGIISGGSEYNFGATALSESDRPSHSVSIDGEICYYDFDRLDWVEPHFMGLYYRNKDSNKPCPDAICTDHGWEKPADSK